MEVPVMFDPFEQKPSEAQPTVSSAVALMKLGDLHGALREVDALIARFPDVAMSHRFRGEVLFELHRYHDSIHEFETAEMLGGPGTEETFFWRALAHHNCGKADLAIFTLQAYVDSPAASPDMVQKCMAAITSIKKVPPWRRALLRIFGRST